MSGKVAETYGGIDILVNNAGIYTRKPLLEMTGDDFRQVIDVRQDTMKELTTVNDFVEYIEKSKK